MKVYPAAALAGAPETFKSVDAGKLTSKFGEKVTIQVAPEDCMGCELCVVQCPMKAKGALKMVEQIPLRKSEAANWKFFLGLPEVDPAKLDTKKLLDSQLKRPLFEFSGACAGCGETPYVKLLTQICGDRLLIANATGCSSIYGGNLPTTPYCQRTDGRGPAWSNSLFEDNAQFGMGMRVSADKLHGYAMELVQKALASDKAPAEMKAVLEKITKIDQYDEKGQGVEEMRAAVKELKGHLEKGCAAGCPLCAQLKAVADNLVRKSVWVLGGDGWAYDIGFGGLDHVLASNHNVNVFVFDTEVYSNTGGQASKASNLGQVAQFAAAGKVTKKKTLAEIAMTYGYVYVAQVAMGANPAQTLKAIQEAEAYDGPSLIIGYSPCEMHSIKGGMKNCQLEMKRAVECGYWNLYRYNPTAPAGKKFSLDSKEPAGGYQEFLMNEARYSRLTREFPERAKELFELNEQAAMDRYQHLLKLKAMYADA